jgi:hypothetical protein
VLDVYSSVIQTHKPYVKRSRTHSHFCCCKSNVGAYCFSARINDNADDTSVVGKRYLAA